MKKPVDTLTRENQQQWFRIMKNWLFGEGLWDCCDPQYDDIGFSSTATYKPDPTPTQDRPKLNAKALYWLNICLGEDDQEITTDCTTARDVWKILVKKYQETLKTTGRQQEVNYINYKKPAETSIEEAWTELSKMARKITSARPDVKNQYTQVERLGALLRSLPEEYNTIRDWIDMQPIVDVANSIAKLEEKEAQLKANDTESAMYAGRNNYNKTFNKGNRNRDREKQNRSWRRHSSDSDENIRQKKKDKRIMKGPKGGCYICGGNHCCADCCIYDKVLEMSRLIRQVRKKEELNNKAKDNAFKATISTSRSASPTGNTSSVSESYDEDDSDIDDEVAALCTELVSKDLWIADTGASSPMTDNLRLFRGPLTPIRRRTIKVGGGVLYSDQRGTAEMIGRNGRTQLAKCLYVPGLGVNLLSGRRLCSTGLRGSFDSKGLYLHDKHGKEMLRALTKNGIYIVDTVAPQLNEYALMARIRQRDTGVAMPAMINLTETSDNEAPAPEMSIEAQAGSDIDEIKIEYSPPPLTREMPQESQQQAITTASISKELKLKKYQLWHRRFGHLGAAKLRNLHKVTTLKKPIAIAEDDVPCEVCSLTKLTNSRKHQCSDRKSQILESISMDICGPLPKSRRGYRYFIEIVDNHSRKSWVLFLRKRSDAQEVLRQWKLQVELKSGAKLISVRCDNAGELKDIVDEWCTSIGVTPEYTEPYNSWQNGIGERGIRTTENQIRAMIKDAGLPFDFWPEAARADTYVRNRVATGPIVDGEPTTPEQAFTGVRPSIDHIRVWGCKCYSSLDRRSLPSDGRQDKLVDTGRPCIFLGYDEETETQWQLWAPDLKKLIKAHRVKFSEYERWNGDLGFPIQTPNAMPPRRPVGRPKKVTQVAAGAPATPIQIDEPELDQEGEGLTPEELEVTADSTVKTRSATKSKSSDVDPSPEASSDSPPAENVNSTQNLPSKAEAKAAKMVKQFLHVAVPKRQREDDEDPTEHRDKIIRAMMALLATENKDLETEEWGLSAHAQTGTKFTTKLVIPVPASYEEAINDPIWGKLWLKAIQNELNALVANGTWDIVVPPPGTNIVTSKWVFKAKMHIDGSLDKLKARLVARGFSQICGVDFTDTFAPTVRFDTLRLFLIMVALEDLECDQVDVNNAFTESFLKEKIYMKPPPGVDLPPGQCLLILRSLYGLKQAARDWHKTCVSELVKLGFEQTPSDPCMLRHLERGIILLVYVDDISIAAKKRSDVNWFKDEFAKVFKIKDLGEMSVILGIRITRNRKERTIRLDQTRYLSDLIDSLNMTADKSKPIELPMNGYDSLRPAGPNDKRINQHDYQHKVGKIMYAAIHTRPDIAFATGRLSQYLSDPAKHHGTALKTLLCYIRSTLNRGIMYGGMKRPKVIGYADSDYAADKYDRVSILGYVYMLAGGPISWMSRKQKSVATSTTEAEYMAVSTCAKEGLWLIQLLKDMGFAKYLGNDIGQIDIVEDASHESSSALQLKGDNQATITLVKDAHIHERSKHIGVSYHHVRGLAENNIIQLDYIPSADMVADGMTKPLPKKKFKSFVKQLGLHDSRISGS